MPRKCLQDLHVGVFLGMKKEEARERGHYSQTIAAIIFQVLLMFLAQNKHFVCVHCLIKSLQSYEIYNIMSILQERNLQLRDGYDLPTAIQQELCGCVRSQSA